MSKILDMAKDFEKKSKQQAHDTESSLKSEFERHEKCICEALRLSEQKIKADISAQNRRMSGLVLKTWLWMVLSIVIVLASMTGVLWWQGTKIRDNWQSISQQNATIKQLEAKGGKIKLTTCNDKGKKHLCVKVDSEKGSFGDSSKNDVWVIPEGY